jgi:hypothetical protein
MRLGRGLRVDGSVGDERNALLLVTLKTAGPTMGSMTIPAARLYLLDENNEIKAERGHLRRDAD